MRSLADGSNDKDHLGAAAIRAVDAYLDVIKRADRLIEVIDEITLPGVVATATPMPVDDDDSLVQAIIHAVPVCPRS